MARTTNKPGAALPAASVPDRGCEWGGERAADTNQGAREACSGQGPACSANFKADRGAGGPQDIWGRELDQVLEES